MHDLPPQKTPRPTPHVRHNEMHLVVILNPSLLTSNAKDRPTDHGDTLESNAEDGEKTAGQDGHAVGGETSSNTAGLGSAAAGRGSRRRVAGARGGAGRSGAGRAGGRASGLSGQVAALRVKSLLALVLGSHVLACGINTGAVPEAALQGGHGLLVVPHDVVGDLGLVGAGAGVGEGGLQTRQSGGPNKGGAVLTSEHSLPLLPI
jgi:hypothetical protein